MILFTLKIMSLVTHPTNPKTFLCNFDSSNKMFVKRSGGEFNMFSFQTEKSTLT